MTTPKWARFATKKEDFKDEYHKIIDAIDNVSEEQIQECARMHRECVDKLVKGGFARMEMQYRKLLSELKIEITNIEEDDSKQS